jgi:hypothetical protein
MTGLHAKYGEQENRKEKSRHGFHAAILRFREAATAVGLLSAMP